MTVIARGAEQKGRGRAFGSFVHAILESAEAGSVREQIEEIARLEARRYRVREDEIRWAVDAVFAALQHPLIQSAARAIRRHREYPVVTRLDDGRLVEGVVDLACFDGESWTVIDFKTGPGDQPRYKHQLGLYAMALHRVTGRPVRAVLFEV